MSPRRQHVIGEQLLPGMDDRPFPPVELGSRVSLARALTPDFAGLRIGDYDDIGPDVVRLALAENLEPSLIDVPRGSPGAVGYRPHGANHLVCIAVTPAEFQVLAGNARTLGDVAVSRSLRHRGYPAEARESDIAASVRAGLHAVDTKNNKLLLVESKLTRYQALLGSFQEAADHLGMARLGSEATMRVQLTYLREFVFGELLAALGHQRGWDPDQAALAKRALDATIFLDRSNNRHVDNFKRLLELCVNWNGHKLALTRTQLWQVRQYVRKNQPKV